jgi:hypothetical protein
MSVIWSPADGYHFDNIISLSVNERTARSLNHRTFIIPGGGDIIACLAQAGIYEIERAPILNGIIELVKMAKPS